MPEAVRLIEDDQWEVRPVPDSQKSALAVGLGIAVIDDAVLYVNEKSRTDPRSFNYIIHDGFTGGAEPVYLFTQEFSQGLINYAGDLSPQSTRLVLNTIHSVFLACRIFLDTPPLQNWKPGDSDFINIVIFCIKNDHDKGKFALPFRQADEDDWRGSIARHNYLRPKEELEVQFDYVHPDHERRVMKKKDVGELEKWHKQGAAGVAEATEKSVGSQWKCGVACYSMVMRPFRSPSPTTLPPDSRSELEETLSSLKYVHTNRWPSRAFLLTMDNPALELSLTGIESDSAKERESTLTKTLVWSRLCRCGRDRVCPLVSLLGSWGIVAQE
ncbi:hypothetical protein K469DRAFT_682849 [Zopfia rhizophila CBS 207.26]|uniref:Uncharacterized protein n=1 Tax=Zopfia rhizophila CBS 207.26 TaxID=1314779 RepID=A0A6A6DEF4_9PEZI|nr:hypothetical protein K469DRAFT_682849 [Zopfia rhizophila CBS 207.26]